MIGVKDGLRLRIGGFWLLNWRWGGINQRIPLLLLLKRVVLLWNEALLRSGVLLGRVGNRDGVFVHGFEEFEGFWMENNFFN